MSEPMKVLIFLGDKKCAACNIFKPKWDILCQNEKIRESFYCVSFIGNGNVGALQPGETKLAIPAAFKNYRSLPTLLIVSLEEYSKRWDLFNCVEINAELPISGVSMASGIVIQVMDNGVKTVQVNTEKIIKWILSNK